MASPAKKRKLKSNLQKHISQPTQIFHDICVYIVPIKLPNQRVQFLKQLAAKKGFPIAESYSPKVTHIVTAVTSIDRIKAHLDSENINKVEVVSVEWLTTSFTDGQPTRVTDRFRLVPKKSLSLERFSAFDRQASLENNTQLSDGSADGESSLQLTKYECQRVTTLDHYNRKLVEALELLESHALLIGGEQSQGRALAFKRSSTAMKGLPKEIENVDEISSLRHLGNHSLRIIGEILTKGYSDEVEQIRNSEFYKATKLFNNIFGVGPTTARYWYDKGLRTFDDLRNSEIIKLTDRQQSGLDNYDELCEPVTLEQAQRIRDMVQNEIDIILPGTKSMLVGGHRRGKKAGHDTDILIWHPEEGKERGLLTKLVDRLELKGYIKYKEMINIDANTDEAFLRRTNSRGLSDIKEKPGKAMDHLERCFGIFSFPRTLLQLLQNDDNPSAARRVDLIVTPASQWAYALVGWTGNKQYNRSLRLYAWKELQINLSSHAAFDCREQKLLPASTEQDIFNYLKLTYREPWERNC
ncbi:DNA-directed DNA/RNA polymerase mu [Trichoplax sp. H2]|nr:DNA-directed DNA/RNA polymerase mu [Trichoplax sp. H2]|eukprot:RDD43530.1 DNA-directed DNA/RNA polymerase mu [Trichoplax sp. H2]